MLNLVQIMEYYPTMSPDMAQHCLREYLQYKVLKSIFASPLGGKLRFIGGTALRIVYGNMRFSEDLDFDNINDITFEQFTDLGAIVQKDLEAEGLTVRMKTIQKGAFHCNISIPELLYSEGLAPMKNQTILIQIDTVSHGYTYEPTRKILNKFDIQTPILTCTPELLLAHKLYTVFERKRMKGRDFFDIVFLLGRDIKPDMGYIQAMMGINTPQALHAYILDKCVGLDLAALQRDAQPFLFNSQDQSVVLFPEIIAQARFL